MLPKINPTETAAWKALLNHHTEMKKVQMKALFAQDPKRFKKMSLELKDIYFDYSKNIITDKTLELILQLTEDCKVKAAMKAMLAGEKINETEDRAVMHIALRDFTNNPITVGGKDIMPEVREARQKMKSFCSKIHSG